MHEVRQGRPTDTGVEMWDAEINALISTAAKNRPLPLMAWLQRQSQEVIWGTGLGDMRARVEMEYDGKPVLDELHRRDLVHILDADLLASKDYLPHAVWYKLYTEMSYFAPQPE